MITGLQHKRLIERSEIREHSFPRGMRMRAHKIRESSNQIPENCC